MNFLNALAAPFGAIWREVRGVLASPLAFFGGLAGMVVMCSALVAFFLFAGEAQAEPEDEDLWDIEFTPGALVKIGKEIPEDEIVITEETVARDEPTEEVPEEEVPEEEEQVAEEVTKTETKPAEDKKEPTKKKPKKITPKPSKEKPEDKPKDTKKADKNTKKNTPYDDLPTSDTERGDPFGDPQGWSELKKDGDPWATAVMKALNGMAVGTFAAQSFPGDYLFRIQICKDGRIKKVYDKGGSAAAADKGKVKGALLSLKLPKPPPDLAKKMGANCKTIPYRFRYGSGKVK
jgi:outer membrane biosynthesis protein TonB